MIERIRELAELFALMPDWMDRYNYLIELGNALPPMPIAFKVPENRIVCNSMLYFHAYCREDICYIEAEANTAIPQGLAALLYSFFNGQNRKEICENWSVFESFLRETGLPEHLTAIRRQALCIMLKNIKKIA